MDETGIEFQAFGAALLMHEAGHIAGDDILRTRAEVIADLVLPHPHRYRLFRHRECATEAAAFVRACGRDEFDAFDAFEQRAGFGKRRPGDF